MKAFLDFMSSLPCNLRALLISKQIFLCKIFIRSKQLIHNKN